MVSDRDCMNDTQAALAAVMVDTGVAIDHVYLASDTQPTQGLDEVKLSSRRFSFSFNHLWIYRPELVSMA
jgi:hypothetical protein